VQWFTADSHCCCCYQLLQVLQCSLPGSPLVTTCSSLPHVHGVQDSLGEPGHFTGHDGSSSGNSYSGLTVSDRQQQQQQQQQQHCGLLELTSEIQ